MRAFTSVTGDGRKCVLVARLNVVVVVVVAVAVVVVVVVVV